MGYSVRHGSDTIPGLSAGEALAAARALFAKGAVFVSIHDPDGDPISLRTLDRRVQAGDLPATGLFGAVAAPGVACR